MAVFTPRKQLDEHVCVHAEHITNQFPVHVASCHLNQSTFLPFFMLFGALSCSGFPRFCLKLEVSHTAWGWFRNVFFLVMCWPSRSEGNTVHYFQQVKIVCFVSFLVHKYFISSLPYHRTSMHGHMKNTTMLYFSLEHCVKQWHEVFMYKRHFCHGFS